MLIDRRDMLSASALLALSARTPGMAATVTSPTGNPILPGRGVTDPQIRVWNDEVFMYATHDADASGKGWRMDDWWVWSSRDLVDWRLRSVIKPEITYLRAPNSQCWATDAAHRNGRYYFYFSAGPRNIGVLVGDTPVGPWRDPLGKPLIADGQVPTASRDPGILQEADGTSYIVFGTYRFFIARLNEDMISLAEPLREITVLDPEGPYGKGKTDDKPFLHRRGDIYYLSWGSFYGTSDSPYGPFQSKGAIIQPDRVDRALSGVDADPGSRAHKTTPFLFLNYDRHASFFDFQGQSYFACNDQSRPGRSQFFRDSAISYLHYRANGDMAPVRLTTVGVGQYSAAAPIRAADYFAIKGGEVRDLGDDRFAVATTAGAHLRYPRVRDIRAGAAVTLTGRNAAATPVVVEVRRRDPRGAKLAQLVFAPGATSATSAQSRLRATDDICLVIRSGDLQLEDLRLT